MHSMITVVALFNTIQAISEKPNWQADYKAAINAVAVHGKPMAIFIGSGSDGWSKVTQEAALNKEVLELLKEKYICVYVNTETTKGKTLADSFEIKTTGLVISDAKGAKQAFSHEGSLTLDDLKLALVRYSDTNRVAYTTESITSLKAPTQTLVYRISGCANGQCGSSAPVYSNNPTIGSPTGYPVYGYPARGNCPNGRCPN